MKFNNKYLTEQFKNNPDEFSQIQDSWGMTDRVFTSKLDNWFDNFDAIDYPLAHKILKNIKYFSQEYFDAELEKIERYICRKILKLNIDQNKIFLIVPDGYGDSAHKHSYEITKIWKEIRTDQIISIRDLKEKKPCENCALIAFNDTYGSGKQFVEQIIGDNDLENILNNSTLFIVGITISKQARKYLSYKLPQAIIIPNTDPQTIFDTFSYEEFLRIESIGSDIYPPHPLGYGKTGLLVAYNNQCPNNSIPLIWANSETKNNTFEGIAYPWTPLFEYKPKVSKSNKDKNKDNDRYKPFTNRTKLKFTDKELTLINNILLEWKCSFQMHAKILKRLAKWFENFRPDEKQFALSILSKINYLSLEKTRELIRELRNKVIREVEIQHDKKEDIIMVLTGDRTESSYHYVYDFMRIWGIRMSQVLTLEHLCKHPYEATGKHLIYFYHSRIHKQETFITDVWPKAKLLPAKFHHILSFMLSESAKEQFEQLHPESSAVIFKYYYCESASKCVSGLLDKNEIIQLEDLFKAKQIKTAGIKDKFLTVYYFKCLKDVLSLLWYDRKVNPLFESK